MSSKISKEIKVSVVLWLILTGTPGEPEAVAQNPFTNTLAVRTHLNGEAGVLQEQVKRAIAGYGTPVTVRISGSSASGKTSVARRISEDLGLAFIDAGRFYRLFTWIILQEKIDLQKDDWEERLRGELERIQYLSVDGAIHLHYGELDVEGENALARALYGPLVEQKVPEVANILTREKNFALPFITSVLDNLYERGIGVVFVGADIFDIVPDVEIFITADVSVRAARRADQLIKMNGLLETYLDELDKASGFPLIQKKRRIVETVRQLPVGSVVLIGGATAGGKTELALEIIAKAVDRKIKVFPMDNYFKNLAEIPVVNGETMFDHPDALDMPLMIQHLQSLTRGETIRIPVFDFGQRARTAETVEFKLEKDELLIIEGIHALSDQIVSVPRGNEVKVFKIFVDAAPNARLLKRMIRDEQERGITPYETLSWWPTIRQAEESYVLPTQRNADMTIDYKNLLMELFEEREGVMRILQHAMQGASGRPQAQDSTSEKVDELVAFMMSLRTPQNMREELITIIKNRLNERDAQDIEMGLRESVESVGGRVSVIDTTDISIEEVEEEILKGVNNRMSQLALLTDEEQERFARARKINQARRAKELRVKVRDLLVSLTELPAQEDLSDTLKQQMVQVFPELEMVRQVNPLRFNHVFRVNSNFHRLTSGDSDYFYRHLPAEEQEALGEEGKRRYLEGIKKLQDIYESFSDEEKELSWLIAILHDIGCCVREREHPAHSADLSVPILKRLGYSNDLVTLVVKVIEHHILIGSTGVGEMTPRHFLDIIESVPEHLQQKFVRLLLIQNAMDLAGYSEGVNELTLFWLESFLRLGDIENLREMDLRNGFLEYRLRRILSGTRNGFLAEDSQYELIQSAISRLVSEEERGFFQQHLNTALHINWYAASILFLLKEMDPDFTKAVKLLRFATQAAELTLRGEYPFETKEVTSNLYEVPVGDRRKVVSELARLLDLAPATMSLGALKEHLDGNDWTSFFGIPLKTENGRLVIDIAGIEEEDRRTKPILEEAI